MTLKEPISFNESRKTGEFIVSEFQLGRLSRDTGELAKGYALQDGTVLKFATHTDGTEIQPLTAADFDTEGALNPGTNIAGILIGPHDTSSDATGVNSVVTGVPYIARIAAVNKDLLIYFSGATAAEIAAVVAALAAAFVIVR